MSWILVIALVVPVTGAASIFPSTEVTSTIRCADGA
jgi:hypothetical protein